MFSKMMSAFTEVAEMDRNEDKKKSKNRPLFSIKCSRGALSIVHKIENWKNTKNFFLPTQTQTNTKPSNTKTSSVN